MAWSKPSLRRQWRQRTKKVLFHRLGPDNTVARAFVRLRNVKAPTTEPQGSHTMERKPQITLSSLDLERIETLLEKNSSNFPGRDALEAELDRADVLDPQQMIHHLAAARQIIVPEGDHSMSDFGGHLAELIGFLGR